MASFLEAIPMPRASQDLNLALPVLRGKNPVFRN